MTSIHEPTTARRIPLELQKKRGAPKQDLPPILFLIPVRVETDEQRQFIKDNTTPESRGQVLLSAAKMFAELAHQASSSQ